MTNGADAFAANRIRELAMEMAHLQRFPGTSMLLGAVLGAGVGVAVGPALGDVSLWVGAGVGLGSVLGYLLRQPCTA